MTTRTGSSPTWTDSRYSKGTTHGVGEQPTGPATSTMKDDPAITYTIDLDRGIVISKATAATTVADMKGLFDRLRGDPDFDPSFGQLADYADTRPVHVSSDELRQMAELSAFLPTAKRALIVQPGIQYGLARMYQTMSEQSQTVGVFASQEEALEWVEGGAAG